MYKKSLLHISIFLGVLLVLACGGRKVPSWSLPANLENERAGKALFFGMATCNSCHGSDAQWFGQFNTWTAAQLRSAIKYGSDKQGSSFDGHSGYRWLADRDVFNLISYIASRSEGLKIVDQAWEESTADQISGHVPQINPRYKKAYGRYLVDNVARCSECHSSEAGIFSSSKYLVGRKKLHIKGNSVVAPALIGENAFNTWSTIQMKDFFQWSLRPDGSTVNSSYCPVESFGSASDQDLNSIMMYMKSLQ